MKKLLPSLLFSACVLTAQAQWTNNAALNTAVQDLAGVTEATPMSAPGPTGGTWVSWFEQAPGSSYIMRVQLLDRNGNKTLGPNGLLVSANPQSTALYRYDLKSDAAGNAILAFQDTRSGSNTQCVVYKISPSGTQLWGANGIQLLDPAATSGLAPAIAVLNSGNVVVAWNSSGTGRPAVAIQKFSPAGTALWATPMRLQDASASIERPKPLPTGTDDVLLHYVRRSGAGLGVSTMFAQRFDASGTAVWASPTAVSDKAIGFAFFPEPISDGLGGYFVAFNSGNPASASLGDVYVQRVRQDGSTWSTSGTPALAGTATARFDGRLQYVPSQNELYVALTVTNTSQSQSGIAFQRLNPNTGAVLSTGPQASTGVEVFGIDASLYSAQALRDTGAGLIVVYTQNTSALNRLLAATRLSYSGATGTFPTGSGNIILSSAASEKLNYSALPYASNQLVVVWADRRTDDGIYAQTINDSGQLGVITGTRTGYPALPLTLVPNPGAAPVLQLSAGQAQAATLLVHDVAGRVVHQQAVVLPAGPSRILLAAPALAAGLYTIELSIDGFTWRGRWVKAQN
ncbi:hypothetical protein GCM10023185_32800 [Hymenobacter saemangeumensis]|uniref:T9SS type A sorting domain-containing protein n=1 Tax=Hymenobacter saemangeumensis TaxID=1084522 RepID=A0ABP8INI2_9BACT